MKVYFVVIIIVLVIVILLLFYLLYKIYILHIKTYEDGYYDDDDEEVKHLNATDEVDAASYAIDAVESSQESLSSKTGSSSIIDETNTSAVQPNIKSVVGPILSNITQDIIPKNGTKEKCTFTVILEYDNDESRLRVTLLDAVNLPKSKSGSSEAYVDMQLTPYKRRTYRPPGYRRPLRGCLKRPVDFTIQQDDLQSHYFLLFLLRYDPFSRLKVDGEAMKFLNELDGLPDEEQICIDLELYESDQQFTGFIFRHGSGSTRSLNGSSRSHNGSSRSHNGSSRSHNGSSRSHNGSSRSPGVRRSQDDSVRASARSFNGFARSRNDALFDDGASSEERLRASSRSFNGFSKPRDELRPSRSPERKLRESSRSFNTSLQPQSGLIRGEDGKFRESSRSFSGFTRARDRPKLPPSGLTRSKDDTLR